MALTDLQRHILHHLAANRLFSSYVARGLALNADWPRLSDDIDIFHDTDEEIFASAERDLAVLEKTGFSNRIDIEAYGIVEATIGGLGDETQIQLMSESRRRFLSLLRDPDWGARLTKPDLSVNKIVAASTRRKARDLVDVHAIAEFYCPLGPLIIAAAGKPPFFSSLRIVDEVRRVCLGLWDDDIVAVRGMPEAWTPSHIRSTVAAKLDAALAYLEVAPEIVIGRLALDNRGHPVEVDASNPNAFQIRAATDEPDVMPQLKDSGPIFDTQANHSS